MKLGYALPQLDGTPIDVLDDQIRRLAEMGYDGAEYYVCRPKDVNRCELHKILDKYGMELSGIRTGAIYDMDGLRFSHPNPEVRRQAVDRMKEACELAGEFHTVLLLGRIQGVLEEGEDFKSAEEWITECLRECSEYAGKCGTKLILEPLNRFELSYHHNTKEMVPYLKHVNSSINWPVELLVDVFHMMLEEDSIAAGIIRSRHMMGHVHFSDSDRCEPGSGNIDFLEVLKILNALEYDKYITVEIIPRIELFEAAERSIKYLKPLLETAYRK